MRNREREKDDFYRTPAQAAKLANLLIEPNLNYWECCAGDGAILDNVSNITYASDINPRRGDIQQLDFLNVKEKPQGIDAIVTNPPFFLNKEIIEKALFDFRIKALLLIRHEWLATKNRTYLSDHASKVFVVSELVKFETESGRIMNGNGTARVAWVLFEPEKPKFQETKFLLY